VRRIGLLLIMCVELCVVAGRSRTRAGSCLLMVALCRGLEKNGMVRAWHGRGMASVNQTRSHCVNQMRKTHSKLLAARHSRGTAWARHAMCESAFSVSGSAMGTDLSVNCLRRLRFGWEDISYHSLTYRHQEKK
jgi:hypothetical protein